MKKAMSTFLLMGLILSHASFADTFDLDEAKVEKKCKGLEIDGDTLKCTKAKNFKLIQEA